MVLAIGGVLKPSAGKVMLDERDYAGKRPERIRAPGSRSSPRAAGCSPS